jgi:hypothetical protein
MRIETRRPLIAAGRTASIVGVLALAMSAGACEQSHGPQVGIVFGPSASSTALAGAFSFPSAFPFGSAFACVSPFAAAPFDVVLTASSAVDLQQVTLRLGDGSHVGGPSVTIARADLAARFGSTVILRGARRTLTLRPEFACPHPELQFLLGDITFTDLVTGASSMTTVSATIR